MNAKEREARDTSKKRTFSMTKLEEVTAAHAQILRRGACVELIASDIH